MLKLKIVVLILFFMGHAESFAGTIFSSIRGNFDRTETDYSRSIKEAELRRALAHDVFKALEIATQNSKEKFSRPASELHEWIEQQGSNKENIADVDFIKSFNLHYASCVQIIKKSFYDALDAQTDMSASGIVKNSELQQEIAVEFFDVLQAADNEQELARFGNINLFYRHAKQCNNQECFRNDFVETVGLCVQYMSQSKELGKYFPEMKENISN